MRARIPLLLGTPVFLAVTLLIVFLLKPQSEQSGASLPRATGTDGSALQLHWRAGSSQRYTVQVESSFLLTMPGASSGQSMNLQIEGILDYRTLETAAAGTTAGMRFASIDMAIDGARDAGVNRSLGTPFRVRFDNNGLPLAFEFPGELATGHREVLENLVRMFQAVILEGDSWQVEETNASGRYEASYASTSLSTVVKHKQRYLGGSSTATVPEVTSTEAIRIDANHDWITDMRVTETLVIRDPGSTPIQVKNHASIQLQATQHKVAANSWGFPASAPPDIDVEPAPVRATPLAPEEAERRLVDEVALLDAAAEGRSLLIQRVSELLRTNNQLPELLLESMRTQALSDRTRADLYLAFELAGTPAAQTALNSVLADASWPPQDAMRAIVALGGVAEPTADTLDTLWLLAHTDLAGTERRDLPATAALAIGSLGSTLRSSDDAYYLSLRADLLVSASSASEPQARAVFLYALANTADPDPTLRRDIVPYLEDPSPRVRSAAARTLGRLGTDVVAQELMRSVAQETNNTVRASITEALASWETPTPAAIEWARGAIRSEPDEATRYNMAVLLGNNLEQFPENRALLAALLETEQSRRIRQQVAEMLY